MTKEDTFEVRAYTREEVDFIAAQFCEIADPNNRNIFENVTVLETANYYKIRLDTGDGVLEIRYRMADEKHS